MNSKAFNTVKTEESTNVWLTPRELLDKLGHFDLDPCAATIRPWDCADINYTKEDNGLIQQWFGRVWCNPPYGSEAYPFLKKFSEYKGPGLMLLFTRTDIKAWHDYIFPTAKYLFFIKGRLKFCRPDGSQKATANAASCLIAWDESEFEILKKLEKEGLGKLAILS